MSTAIWIVYGVFMVLAVTSWLIGMINYFRLARAADIGFIRMSYSFDVYRYAFREARGSLESKLMVGGFIAMLVFFFLGLCVPLVLRTPSG